PAGGVGGTSNADTTRRAVRRRDAPVVAYRTGTESPSRCARTGAAGRLGVFASGRGDVFHRRRTSPGGGRSGRTRPGRPGGRYRLVPPRLLVAVSVDGRPRAALITPRPLTDRVRM
ncbi:hypothetical protein, partial [Saccharothrix longispora]|uniref:hypothetical protein n=1 Tax=Saccharothrix longispora TaxID=33920 RepID=UPI0028FD64E1